MSQRQLLASKFKLEYTEFLISNFLVPNFEIFFINQNYKTSTDGNNIDVEVLEPMIETLKLNTTLEGFAICLSDSFFLLIFIVYCDH